jgi:PTS system nitrogen regulatory IIA component
MQLSVRDVMRALNVPEKTIYRWINHDGLPASCVNGQFRFNRAELLEWATAHHVPISGDLLDSGSHALPVPELADALEAGGVFYRLPGKDRESALRSVVEVMPLGDDVDRPMLLGVLLAREALASTGIGDGIAIPHVRSPIVLHVAQPMITLCFLAQPIEFDAMDGQPVHTLFSVISPTVRAHLHLLSRLAFSLRDPGFKSALLAQQAPDVILREARRVEAGLPKAK